jgi:hypothetical protein
MGCTLLSGISFAQSPPDPDQPPPPSTTQDIQPPKPPQPIPVIRSTSAQNSFTCGAGEVADVNAGSARTIVKLICNQVNQESANLQGVGGHFRVHVQPIGGAFLIGLGHENPVGTTQYEQQLQVNALEEVPRIASRLVLSVLQRKTTEQQQTVRSVTSSEARPYTKKKGHFSFGLGIIGMVLPGREVSGVPGLDLNMTYDMPQFAMVTGFRFATGSPTDNKGNMVNFGVGFRGYFSEADISPFLGGGLNWTYLHFQDPSGSYDNGGIAPHAEFGIDFFRTNSSHLLLGARMDIPLWQLKSKDESPTPFTTTTNTNTTRYVLPLTFFATIVF